MSAEYGLQRALYQKLTGDSSIAALLAVDLYEGSPTLPAVYDHVPQEEAAEDASAFPYIVIGDYTAAEADTDDINGQELTVILHVFDRRSGSGRAKQVIDAIYDALHNKALDVQGHSVIYCFWEFGQSVPDEDPLTQHEVSRFRVFTQEA